MKERLVLTIPLRLLLVLRTHLAGGNSGKQQTVARVNLGPEI